jgi:LysM repeat protein
VLPPSSLHQAPPSSSAAASTAAPAPTSSIGLADALPGELADDPSAEEEEGLDQPSTGDNHDAQVDPDDMDEFDGTMLDLHGGGAQTSMPSSPVEKAKSPLATLSSQDITRMVKEDLGSLGPLSLGLPNHGRLVNGVQMPKSEHWTVTDPGNCWGTQETVDNLALAIDKVNKSFEGTPKMVIGHISSKHGGHLSPHKSHQAGRDVDISYFYKGDTKWYAVANADNLDKPRTWAFVKTLVKETPIEMIFIDSSVQRLLKDYALSVGEDPKWLDQVFQVGSKNPLAIVRHVKGHATHIHIRFFSPVAQASARIAAPYLPRKEQPSSDSDNAIASASSGGSGSSHSSKAAKKEYVLHRARSGDTLDGLARRYGVSVKDIQEANGLKSNAIKQKMTYRIPKIAKAGDTGKSMKPAPTASVGHTGGHSAKQKK